MKLTLEQKRAQYEHFGKKAAYHYDMSRRYAYSALFEATTQKLKDKFLRSATGHRERAKHFSHKADRFVKQINLWPSISQQAGSRPAPSPSASRPPSS